jgi:hypothetical protein
MLGNEQWASIGLNHERKLCLGSPPDHRTWWEPMAPQPDRKKQQYFIFDAPYVGRILDLAIKSGRYAAVSASQADHSEQ